MVVIVNFVALNVIVQLTVSRHNDDKTTHFIIFQAHNEHHTQQKMKKKQEFPYHCTVKCVSASYNIFAALI